MISKYIILNFVKDINQNVLKIKWKIVLLTTVILLSYVSVILEVFFYLTIFLHIMSTFVVTKN